MHHVLTVHFIEAKHKKIQSLLFMEQQKRVWAACRDGSILIFSAEVRDVKTLYLVFSLRDLRLPFIVHYTKLCLLFRTVPCSTKSVAMPRRSFR